MTISIPLWLLWSVVGCLGSVLLWLLLPNVTRNHDGDSLCFWMGRRWIKPRGSNKWRRV